MRPDSREPHLLLAPGSARGWFGGRAIEGADPIDARAGLTLAEAACLLEEVFESEGSGLVAVLAGYDGTCSAVRYSRWVESAGPHRTLAVTPGDPAAPLLHHASWDLGPEAYRSRVEHVRERVAAGDVYVLNLTARLTGEPALGPGALFAELNARTCADMAGLVESWPGDSPWLASASPERFVRVRRERTGERHAEICPIKGTRARGATALEDSALAEELLGDEKERAEHLMIVDLERNDLGVVAVPGTVVVDPLYEVVTTPYCHQLASRIRATLRTDARIADLLRAIFPCGSVTGAPKVAAMRIIDELELTSRSAYCGALIVAIPGEIDSSVLIRTLEGDGAGGARWGAGAGITHDSDPAAEWLETLLKASPVTGDGAPPVACRETLRVAYGRVPLLDRHLARLASAGAGPGVLARVRDQVARRLAEPGASESYARLSITVTPDGGVASAIGSEPSSLDVRGGVRLEPVIVGDAPSLPPRAAKPASRSYWDRAHRTARLRGADQALLVTSDGALIDGSTVTVWLVSGGVLLTPPAPPAIAGIARGLVFDIAEQAGREAHEVPLTMEDFASADEVFLTNAVGLVAPVREREGPVSAWIKAEVGAVFSR